MGYRPDAAYCSSCNDYSGKIRGAGDLVHLLVKGIKADKIAKAIENKTGKPCGCGERRKRLNQFFPRKTD
jgi:hypothetical protein